MIPNSIPDTPGKHRVSLWQRLSLIQKLGCGGLLFFVLLCVLVAMVLLAGLLVKDDNKPGKREFVDADSTIISSRAGTAHGNSSDAQSLAAALSSDLSTIRKMGFKSSNPFSSGLNESDCLVYCQLNEDSCVFLIYVPELNKFESPAKESMGDYAYLDAQKVLDEQANTKIRTVIVATRGRMFYDRMVMGHYYPRDLDPLAKVSRERLGGMFPSTLFSYFVKDGVNSASQGEKVSK